MLSTLLRDIRLAFRNIRRRPAFATAVIGALALAIGANTAIFTVVRAVLLRSLPFAHHERLVAIHYLQPGNDRQPVSIADFFDIAESNRSFEALLAYGAWSANLTGIDEPVALPAQWVSRGFFRELGLRAALGRTPLPEEEAPGGPKVLLLGDGLWRSRFGADPSIVGRSIRINGRALTVVGVMPPGFRFPEVDELWVPLGSADAQDREARWIWGIGRLAEGVSPAGARSRLRTVAEGLAAAYPVPATRPAVRPICSPVGPAAALRRSLRAWRSAQSV